ncbi:MAG: hypothetical protein U9R52_00915 [Candidatus Omnitrophota bacterium]|nr:hypothetical protein [Candidatus Omnitrophota bacterium]
MNGNSIQNVKKKGMSTGAKWGLGCGIGCLTIIIIISIGIFMAVRFVKDKIDETASELTQLGFETVVKKQMIEVRADIIEPTLYIGQSVKIMGDCSTNLAVMAQICEIHGKIDGKVYFRGQMLIIQPKAELKNGLNIMAQLLQKYGKIEGEITGDYQMVPEKTSKELPGSDVR